MSPPRTYQQRFAVGTRFYRRGKHPRIATIVDVWTTRNTACDVVRVRYVAEHEFCGQIVRDHDVGDVEVAKGIISEN